MAVATDTERAEGAERAKAVPQLSRRELTRSQNIRRFKWTVLTPLILMIVLVLTPVLFIQLYFSFHSFTIYLGSWWEAEWVGLDIFRDVLTDERLGWAIIRSLLFSGGSTLGCFVIGLVLALLMYRPFRGQSVYYIFFIAPMLTVPIVIAYTGEMLMYQNGPINDLLTRLTGTTVQTQWLTDPDIALTSVLLMEIWNWVPFSFIVLLAGLSSLPKEPVEAARILGASRWRVIWEVQLPLLRPVIVLVLVLRFLEAMAEFPKVWALFQGGPGTATETIPVYIFLTTWQYFDVSKGAAMSYVVMLLMIAIVLVAIKIIQREKRKLDMINTAKGE